MKLIISESRTGKTQKLINAVKAWLGNGVEHKAVIVTPENKSNLVLDNFDSYDFSRIALTERMVDLPNEILGSNVRFFVDDLHKFQELDIESNLEIVKDGFYTSEKSTNFTKKLKSG